MVVKVGKETSIACSDCHGENVARHNALGEKKDRKTLPKQLRQKTIPEGEGKIKNHLVQEII